jgi:hypothetical protein|tara:strand:- start:274 stop:453 length:180 start_codon:yes stop_codon:yes gene_type:complete
MKKQKKKKRKKRKRKMKNRNLLVKNMICKPKNSGAHKDKKKDANKKECRRKLTNHGQGE